MLVLDVLKYHGDEPWWMFIFIHFFLAVGRPFLSRNSCPMAWKSNPKLYLDYFLPSIFLYIFFSFFYFLIFENVIPFSLIPYFFLFYFLSVFFSASRVISSIFTSKTTVEILTSGIICLISKMLVFVLQPSCVPLCDPMDCNTAGFPVPHYLPEFDQIHVY